MLISVYLLFPLLAFIACRTKFGIFFFNYTYLPIYYDYRLYLYAKDGVFFFFFWNLNTTRTKQEHLACPQKYTVQELYGRYERADERLLLEN